MDPAIQLKAEIYDLHRSYGEQLGQLRNFIGSMANKLECLGEDGNVQLETFEARLDQVLAGQVVVEEVTE